MMVQARWTIYSACWGVCVGCILGAVGGSGVADPLFLENTVTVPRINHADQDGVQAKPKPLYLNFQELEEQVGKWSTQRWIRSISFLAL